MTASTGALPAPAIDSETDSWLSRTTLAVSAVLMVCLCLQFWNVTRQWNHSLLGQHSFRQTQTALATEYIVKDGYRLDYVTPLFGPPWSIPMEFPIYQIIVATLVKLLRTPLEQTGRAVSLLSFYLSAIPVWVLLKQLGVRRVGRLIGLVSMLASPLYNYFPGAFLIESTALFFTLAYVTTMIGALYSDRPRWWVAGATLLGLLAALTKVTTFCLGFGFTLLYYALWLWDRRLELSRTMRRTVPMLAALWIIPLGTTVGWNAYADQVKSRNPTPMARVIDSANLSTWNYGSLKQRLSPVFWTNMKQHGLSNIIVNAWPCLAAILLLVSIPAARLPALLLISAFISGPMVFANLYYVHDYYWCANAAFLILALAVPLGYAAQGSAQSRSLALFLTGSMLVNGYWGYYNSIFYTHQKTDEKYIKDIGKAVQLCTTENDVAMVFGFDWDSSVAYYSKRRVIMPWARSFESDPGTMEAVKALDAENRRLGLLIIGGGDRQDKDFIREVTHRFGFSPVPVFDDFKTAMYLPSTEPGAKPKFSSDTVFGLQVTALNTFVPLQTWIEDDSLVWLLHAPSRLGLKLPPDTRGITLKYGLSRQAYTGGGTTDGAEFVATLVRADGTTEILLKQTLTPLTRPTDRGLRELDVHFPPASGARLLLETRYPTGSNGWDWTLWSDLKVTQ